MLIGWPWFSSTWADSWSENSWLRVRATSFVRKFVFTVKSTWIELGLHANRIWRGSMLGKRLHTLWIACRCSCVHCFFVALVSIHRIQQGVKHSLKSTKNATLRTLSATDCWRQRLGALTTTVATASPQYLGIATSKIALRGITMSDLSWKICGHNTLQNGSFVPGTKYWPVWGVIVMLPIGIPWSVACCNFASTINYTLTVGKLLSLLNLFDKV